MNQNRLVCIGDGDNIGDVIEFYLLAGNLEKASQFSKKVKNSIEKIAQLAQYELEASLIYVAGDDICFLVKENQNIKQYLTVYCQLFVNLTGKKISFGVGRNSVEAFINLRKAKVSEKSSIIIFGSEG